MSNATAQPQATEAPPPITMSARRQMTNADPRDDQIAALTAQVAALTAQNAELLAAMLPIARQAVLVRTKHGDHAVLPIWVQAGQIRRCWRAVEAVEPTALPQPRDERRVG